MFGSLCLGIDHSQDTTILSGTSMAAPFVSGVIARYLSHRDSGSDVTCVRQHLLNTAITGLAVIPNDDPEKIQTPNKILFAGCNTCFGDYECVPVINEDATAWSLPLITGFTTPGSAPGTCAAMNITTILMLVVIVVSQTNYCDYLPRIMYL